MFTDARPDRPRTGRRVALVLLLVVLLLVPCVYLSAMFLVIPLLQGQAFDSPAELTPEAIQSLRFQLLNRKELDGGEDVGPYFAAAEDYEKLLAPLKSAAEVEQYPGARGPFLGEYRVVLKSGRKGTIKLYWLRPPGAVPKDDHAPPARLRFEIGSHRFEGGTAEALIQVIEECAARGRK
jgi:hypothetical protein